MIATTVLVDGTYYYSHLDEEIVKQWSSGELFAPKSKSSKNVSSGGTDPGKIKVFADRYSDGNIAFLFFSYNSKGVSSWIGDGELKLNIKDIKGSIIKVWAIHLNKQVKDGELYMGDKVRLARSLDAEYKTDGGKTYIQKGISLKNLLD